MVPDRSPPGEVASVTAAAEPFPVGPLPVPVIEPSFRAFLVFPVGVAMLLQLRSLPAAIPAVGLPPVAGTADVKHHPATRPSTKQLSKHHFLGHRTPHDSIAV